MRLLLTNDDGIHSPGLHAFARYLHAAGHDLVVAAPMVDMSGSSAAIGRLHADEHVEVTAVELPDGEGINAFAVAGPPGLAAMAACLGAFGDPPDVVMSGINTGLNTGHSVLHSGTVGAALTAQNFGRCGIAVSIEPTDPWQWETACEYASSVLAWLCERAAARTVVNVNVPGRPSSHVEGVRWAKLDQFGSVRAAVADTGPEGLQFEFRTTDTELDPESDTALVAKGYVTLTALYGVTEADVENEEPGIAPEQVARELRSTPRDPAVDIASSQ
jgi:5'-nucleotidase